MQRQDVKESLERIMNLPLMINLYRFFVTSFRTIWLFCAMRTMRAANWHRYRQMFVRPMMLLVALVCSGQAVAAGYLEVIPLFWKNLYPNGGASLYCGDQFAPFDRRYNIEHVFPMAWVTRHLRCGSRKQCRANRVLFNQIEADMHNLYPARRDVNKARGAMAYGMVAGTTPFSPSCDVEIDTRRRRVEPPPAVRGEIARAMLYMAQRYHLPLYTKQRRLMLAWHRQDPVEEKERWRNQQILRLQGTSNPWIE